MWSMKCVYTGVVIGATGMVTEAFKNFGRHTRKTFNRLTTKVTYTWNITYNTEYCSLKLETRMVGSEVRERKDT
jgi:hypothetical protein